MMTTRINRVFSLAKLSSTPDYSFVSDNPVERKCIKCKKCYIPTDKDISMKRPSCYYKTCYGCRVKFNNWAQHKIKIDSV